MASNNNEIREWMDSNKFIYLLTEQDSRKTQVLFVCEAVFMEQWMSGLQNHNSLEYRSKLLSIETQV